MIEDRYEEIAPVVEAVASDMARRYYKYGAEREDMAQQCWMWLLDHPTKTLDYLADETYGIKKLARAMRNECHDYGEETKAQHLGYSREDLYYYHKGEVRALLDALFDEEAWTDPPLPEDTGRSGRRDPATGGGWVATLADVSRGFDALGDADKALLHAFHRDGYTNKMLAEMWEITEQTMSYRHDMAVKRLVDILGGPKPQPQHDEDCSHQWRGRRALSNAQARAYQQTAYDE